MKTIMRFLIVGIIPILVLGILLAGSIQKLQAQNGTWVTKSSIPVADNSMATAAMGDNIYIAGGNIGTGPLSISYVYNVTTNTWTSVTSLPQGRYQGDGMCAINGKLYVPGGWYGPLPQSTLYIYDTLTKIWSTGASMPALSGDGASGVINRKLYVSNAENGFSGWQSYFYVYNPDSNNWRTLPNSPNSHGQPAYGVINGKFYLAGGIDQNYNYGTQLDVYDPVADTWTTKAPMPISGFAYGSGVIDNRLYVLGGITASGFVDSVFIYDPSSDSWSIGPSLPFASAGMGSAVSNGLLYVLGGGGASGSVDSVEVLLLNTPPTLISIKDVPFDQGGKVRINWNKAAHDDSLYSPQVTSYSIFRKSSSGTIMNAKAHSVSKSIESLLMDSTLLGYDYVATVPAFQLPTYQTVVPTLEDSDASGTHYFDFLVVAQTTDINQYYVSAVDSGYSVDNIPPIQPAGLLAAVESGPQVKLTWNSPTDPDVGSYSVYRSTTSGFTPSSGSLIGTSNSINFTDASPLPGDLAYYRIIAVDVHGNRSIPSAQVSAAVTVSQEFSMQDKWNLISVPMTVSDFAKTALYPTAISNAFEYSGSGYVITSMLATGNGYWVKFGGAQSQNLIGLLLTNDTINVTTGWNMIGSLSQPIAVSSISSMPGGITTSKFFGYKGSYFITDSIYSGKGYWIKVNQSGKLVLSTSAQASPSTAIRIDPSEELPPTPPDGNDAKQGTIPTTYALEQNYPNPFNPTTIINYSIPQQAFVRLTVFNVLGEEVATLVNEMQNAGNRSVEFNANNFPSGIYFYKVNAGTFSDMKKMILLK